MKAVGLAFASILLPQASRACFTLEGLHRGDGEGDITFVKDSLRDGGDIWEPSERGCNRIPCGAFLNDEPYDSTRIKIHAKDDIMKIKAQLQQIYAGGFVKYEMKYGNNPHFGETPGFEMGQINIAPDSDIVDIFKTIEYKPAYNSNATIQVAYVTDGFERTGLPDSESVVSTNTGAIFYQCIDVEVTGGAPFPSGDFPSGFGPFEKTFIDTRGGAGPVGTRLHPFVIVAIVLGILLLILCVVIIILAFCRRGEESPETPDPILHDVVIPEPEEPKKPPTPTPVEPPMEAAPEPEEEEEDEKVAQLHYQDKEESPKPKLDATGSEGRHFHFRYVEEEDGDTKA